MLRLFFVSLFMILFFTVGQIGLLVGFVIKVFNNSRKYLRIILVNKIKNYLFPRDLFGKA